MSCLSSSCKETSHVPERRCASANRLKNSISMLPANAYDTSSATEFNWMHVWNLKRSFFAQDKFITPRAVLSLALFNGFRVLGTKNVDPEDLRLSVEGMAFKPGPQWCLEPHGVSWCVMCHAANQKSTKCQPEIILFTKFWSFLVSQKSFWFIHLSFVHWFICSLITPGFVSWQAFGIGHDASTCHRW